MRPGAGDGAAFLWHPAAPAAILRGMVWAWITRKGSGRRAKPRTPEDRRVYAVGDIHGRLDLLRSLHELILDDARKAPDKDKVLVYLGDYVDRGPESFGVVETLIHDPLEGFDIVHLKGNHEDFLLRFLDDAALGFDWMFNGGQETLESYDVDVYDRACGMATMESAQERFRAALPDSHLAFFRGLERFHVEGDYVFVHAGVRPGVALERQTDEDLMWIREEFLDSRDDFDHVVVHGHTIRYDPDEQRNRIGVDTGAFLTGRLTCLVLDGTKRTFLHT